LRNGQPLKIQAKYQMTKKLWLLFLENWTFLLVSLSCRRWSCFEARVSGYMHLWKVNVDDWNLSWFTNCDAWKGLATLLKLLSEVLWGYLNLFAL